MSMYPVKSIVIQKWGPLPRYRHSLPGRRIALAGCRRLARKLIAEAHALKSLGDHELLSRSQLHYARPIKTRDVDADCSNFPLVLEAIRRQTTFRLHVNQVVAAIAMRRGWMIELATGEGKTLAALLTACSYALDHFPVHVFTANEYLAERDSELGAQVAERMGLTAAFLDPKADPEAKKKLYRKSMLYSTLHEVAFDWLRDRIAISRHGAMPSMPRLRVALVDEADMVMIDEARTPMLLSESVAGAASRTPLFKWAYEVTAPLRPEIDFDILGPGQVALTPEGRRLITRDLSTEQAITAEAAVLAALRARLFFRRNVNYIVDEENEEIVIVDEKTGRRMPGRRWSDGLYEAITLREGLPLDGPTRHLAQVTVQQFLWQYERLCGCSGTMFNAAREIYCVYGQRTMPVPTHQKCRRVGWPTIVYTTPIEQFRAAAEEIRKVRDAGRSVLVGTTHIATSQRLSALLDEMNIEHHVLNAFSDKDESEIIARAGQPGAVTIATNMAGRGTDIKLDPAVREAGGLHVVSLQRHESARVDRQLVGRCARQGDPGSFQFILCLQDPLLKDHAPDKRLRRRPRRRRFGEPLRDWRLYWLWTLTQKEVEASHRDARVQLILQQNELEKMLGKPDYF
ncbi:MAG: hypothetical protein GC162_07150 [Planctomycetes bacterium]|nr:hypothetical protein [Planctomycetota bacterium]